MLANKFETSEPKDLPKCVKKQQESAQEDSDPAVEKASDKDDFKIGEVTDTKLHDLKMLIVDAIPKVLRH